MPSLDRYFVKMKSLVSSSNFNTSESEFTGKCIVNGKWLEIVRDTRYGNIQMFVI